MALNIAGTTKDRTSNFSKEETTKLSLLLQDYPLITCKKTDHASNLQKEKAWRSLADKFNSDATVHRSIKQLQQKFNNLKKTARKEMSAERNGRRQTGGGPPPAAPSETTEWLNSIMGESISGLPAVFDSDVSGDNTMAKVQNSTAAEIIIMDTNVDIKSYRENIKKTSDDVNNISQNTLQDKDVIHIAETEEDIHKYDEIFDTSTPQSMLRKPISKELFSPNNRRKKNFTPLETRKKIITHIDTKMDLLSLKKAREENVSKFALEDHNQLLKERREMHHKQFSLMEEKHVQFLEQQQELHAIEVEFKKKMNDLFLEKTKLEIEKIQLEIEKNK